ncbi:MAG: hypothetical protein ACFB51_05575 [Anaerolineae bacterium]
MADEEETTPDTSLAGRGWDILVGGRDNMASTGGDDPLDMETGGPISADDETDAILTATTPEPDVPPDAAFDRGRGAEDFSEAQPEGPVMAPITDAVDMTPDLSPEDLDELGSAPPTPAPDAEPPLPVRSAADELPEPEIIEGGPIEAPTVDMGELTREPEVPADDRIAELFDRLETAPAAAAPPTPRPTTPPADPLTSGGILRPASVADTLESLIGGPVEVRAGSNRMIREDPTEDLPPDTDLERLLLTEDRINALWAEIDELYEVVIDRVRGDYEDTQQSLTDLKKARELLLAGREFYDNAEELVNGVKARLRMREKTRQWARTHGAWIGVYLVISLLILSGASIFIPDVTALLMERGVSEFQTGTILPGLFGGLGGVFGALWVLIKHTAIERDFDPSHTSWFVLNPVLGIALGVITYLVLLGASLVVLALFTRPDQPVGLQDQYLLVIYAVCVVVGFRQNFFWQLLERFTKAILPGRDNETKATPSDPTSGSLG